MISPLEFSVLSHLVFRFIANVLQREVINTAKTISWYLKKIQFTGEAFVIATKQFRQVLIDDGFKLVPQEVSNISKAYDRDIHFFELFRRKFTTNISHCLSDCGFLCIYRMYEQCMFCTMQSRS